MPILEPTIERRGNYLGVPIKRVSWSSIFSGVVVGIAVFVALSMLGIAAGAIESEQRLTLSAMNGISWAVIGALSLFVSGWTAGRLCGLRRSFEGALHGFVTWAMASVALLMFAGSFSVALHGMPTQQRSTFLDLEDRAATMEMRHLDLEHERKEIERQADELLYLSDLDEEEQVALHEQIRPEISALVEAIRGPDHVMERARLIDTLVKNTDLNWQMVTSRVDRWTELVAGVEGRHMHKREGRKTRRERRHQRPGVSIGARVLAGWSFLFIAFGAVAAMLGGWLGSNSANRGHRGGSTGLAQKPLPKRE
jgi:hypothetical protein